MIGHGRFKRRNAPVLTGSDVVTVTVGEKTNITGTPPFTFGLPSDFGFVSPDVGAVSDANINIDGVAYPIAIAVVNDFQQFLLIKVTGIAPAITAVKFDGVEYQHEEVDLPPEVPVHVVSEGNTSYSMYNRNVTMNTIGATHTIELIT